MRFRLPICTFILFRISHKPPQASLKSFFAKFDFSLFPPPQFFGASVTLYLIAMLQNAHKNQNEMVVKKQPLALLSADGTAGYQLHRGSQPFLSRI